MVDGRRRTEDRGQMSEVGGRRTEDGRRRKTEDGRRRAGKDRGRESGEGQKTEDGWQKSEVRKAG
jgi:hypothetical protein